MSSEKGMDRTTYLSRNVGEFKPEIEINGVKFEKVDDLRYGTNPHQPAAYYKPSGAASPIADMKLLKTGKSGLSQTNLEDISYSLNIVKYFDAPACAVMKHVNPSGAAVSREGDALRDVYARARDCDARAAFGSVAAFNVEVDADTAEEIMGSFVECVVAPSFEEGVLEIFNDSEKFKLNRHIRVLKCGSLNALPKYVGESEGRHNSIKVLADGSLIVAAPLLTKLRSVSDIKAASAESSKYGNAVSEVELAPEKAEDLLAAWYINLNVRSNGVVIMNDGHTLAVGTGEQDRVGAVEQAVWKYENKYSGPSDIKGSVMASDGFFPFPDAVEVAAEAGVKAIIAPAGSLRDSQVIQRANELGVAMAHAPERCFSHH